MIPDGYLDHVPVAWFPVPKPLRDGAGEIVRDDYGWPRTNGMTGRHRLRPIGWLDRDDDRLIWAVA